MTEIRLCGMKNCGSKHLAKDWCSMHYQRWRKNPSEVENEKWFLDRQSDLTECVTKPEHKHYSVSGERL